MSTTPPLAQSPSVDLAQLKRFVMSRLPELTDWLLAGSFVLILVGAYLLATQARDLVDARDHLKQTNQTLGQRQAQLLVLNDALVASNDQAKAVETVSHKVRTICSHQENKNLEVKALCQLSEWATGSSGEFVAAYAATAAERANAASASDWARVRDSYAALPALLAPGTDPGQLWAARVQEGIAYADYRRGNLGQAAGEADQALALDPRSAFAALTSLKIACAQAQPAGRIQALYAEQRQMLVESAKNPTAPMDKRYAGYELGYFDEDAELRDVCAYAKLPKP